MSLLITPLWQNLNGDPRTGVSPPSLVMLSGRLTPQRHGEIRQIYMRFSMAKLTAVGDYFVTNRVLSDGTRVRIESMQGRDRVFVWASDAQSEGSWDMGWSFIPANDNSLNGFLRRPGAAPDDLSAAAFMPLSNALPAGKKVHTFVDAKTGNRRLCTDREGGARLWRGGKNMPVLSYDTDAVWVDGVKSVFVTEAPERTIIWGAAIAVRDGEKWLVFVGGHSQRLWAVRLSKLKAQTNDCVDCGPIANGGRWEFSPDGTHAISLVSFGWRGGDIELKGICRIKLVPENGTVPFRLEVSEQLHDGFIKKRVINTFHFNEASRNFEFIGWDKFRLIKNRSYSAFVPTGFTGGWGPSISQSGGGYPDKYYKISGSYYDPLISIAPIIYPGSPISAEIVDPASWRPLEDPVVFRDLPKIFGNDNDGAPDSFSYTRELVIGGAGNIPYTPNGYARRHVPALGGWLIESGPVSNIVSFMEATVGTPYSRSSRYSSTHVGLVVRQTISQAHENESFETLEDVGSYCDANWGAYNSPGETITGKILNNYRPVMNLKFTGFLDMHEKLEDIKFNLIETRGGKNEGAYAVKTSYINLINATVSDERPNTPITRVTEEWGTYTREDNGVVTEQEYLSYRLKVDEWTSFTSFVFNATILSTPIYTHNWTTDWVLESQVFLEGKAYIVAGYDAKGRERFLYMEGDDSQRLRYESSAKADNEPVVQLAWNFSGALGYRLMLDEEVIDSCTYAVADGVTLPDRGYSGGENAIGPSPTIRAGQIAVCDFDIALGHVLYRKSEEVFTKEGQSGNRKNALRLSYRDFLKTSKDKHQLGEERVFTSAQREVDYLIAESLATKTLFYETAPCFSTRPGTIVLNGVHIVPPAGGLGGSANAFPNDFASLVPQEQRNKVGLLSGEVEERWSAYWLTKMMLYTPGVDNEICRITEKVLFWNDGVSSGAPQVGRFTKPPQSHMVLMAYSDDCWLVCYQIEKHIQSTSTDNTTARYFLKLAKDKPIVEFDAAAYFQYLGLSKKLLAPKFHIRKKT